MKLLLKKVVLTTLSIALMQTALQAQHPIEMQNKTYIPLNTSEAESPSLVQNLGNKAESKVVKENLEQEMKIAEPKAKSFYQRHKTLITTLATIAITTAVVIIGFKYLSPIRNIFLKKEVGDKLSQDQSITRLEGRIKGLQEQIKQGRGIIDTRNSTIAGLERQLEQANDMIDTHNGTIVRLQGQLEQANDMIDTHNGTIAGLAEIIKGTKL